MFLSHTSELRCHPGEGRSYVDRAERAVSAAGHAIANMADFSAEDRRPAALCQEEVQACEVYVALIGLRYGSPVRERPELSYTELEFETATARGMPRLVFLLDDQSRELDMPASALNDPEHGKRQAAFRRRLLESGLTVQRFRNPDHLGQLLERSLRKLAERVAERSVPQPDPERRHVFISYSRADRAWVEQLRRMMAPLLRGSQQLRLWDDSQIEAGTRWREAIETALAEAKVALLLVSDHFLASEFVMGEEVPKLLAAAEAEGVRVLWVSLTSCLVEETEIHQYQAVLPPSRPLDKMAEAEVKEALKTIGLAIRQALREPPGSDHQLRAEEPSRAAAPSSSKAGSLAPAASPPPAPSQPPAFSVNTGLLPHRFRLETADLLREGNGWRVERRGLEVEGARLELGEGVSLPLVRIPAGEFVMGSPADEPGHASDESPQHRVRLAEFWMGQTPITQAQWRVVARLVPPLGQRWQRGLSPKPAFFQPEGEKSGSVGRFVLLPGEANTDQRPVERVSWHDAVEFCRRLDSLLPAGSGLRFTLPSEAQWEYACRAGSRTPFAFGETLTTKLANYRGSAIYANGPKGEYRQQTTPVGMFPANAWGLQDVHGNVWEWCLDCWQDSYDEAPFDGHLENNF